MAKPTDKPRWASAVTADPTRYVNPPPGKKDIGWDVEERPPSQYENWLRNITGQWVDYLDGFEYDETTNTWLAGQNFAPSLDEPSITVKYNPAVAAGLSRNGLISFKNGSGFTYRLVDRLGCRDFSRWKERHYGWQGRVLVGTIAADTDYEVQGETALWLRNSGIGPAMANNVFTAKVLNPDTGTSFVGCRDIQVASQFESVLNQYNLFYGDTVFSSGGLDAVVLDTVIGINSPASAVDNFQAFGLYQRGTAGAGLVGRDPLVAAKHVMIGHSKALGNIHVFYRDGGVSDAPFDTGVSIAAIHRLRIEIISATALGGPTTRVYLDGGLAYSVPKVPATSFPMTLGAIAKPITVETGVGTDMRIWPVTIAYNDILTY